jgi:hypothetical protein
MSTNKEKVAILREASGMTESICLAALISNKGDTNVAMEKCLEMARCFESISSVSANSVVNISILEDMKKEIEMLEKSKLVILEKSCELINEQINKAEEIQHTEETDRHREMLEDLHKTLIDIKAIVNKLAENDVISFDKAAEILGETRTVSGSSESNEVREEDKAEESPKDLERTEEEIGLVSKVISGIGTILWLPITIITWPFSS